MTESPAQTDIPTQKTLIAHYVEVEPRDSLVIYTPDFKRIDLVTGTMPSKSEEDVILCFEAAFTGELLDVFKHSNIAGHHVSGGVFYKGYKCGTYTVCSPGITRLAGGFIIMAMQTLNRY